MQKGAAIRCKCLEGSLSLLEKSRRESEKWLRFVGIPCMLFLTPFERSRRASKRGRRGVVATVSRSVDPVPWTWWRGVLATVSRSVDPVLWTWWRGAGPVCVRGAAVARSVDPVPWTWWRGVVATVSRSVDPVLWTWWRGAGPVCVRGAAVARSVDPAQWTGWRGGVLFCFAMPPYGVAWVHGVPCAGSFLVECAPSASVSDMSLGFSPVSVRGGARAGGKAG